MGLFLFESLALYFRLGSLVLPVRVEYANTLVDRKKYMPTLFLGGWEVFEGGRRGYGFNSFSDYFSFSFDLSRPFVF